MSYLALIRNSLIGRGNPFFRYTKIGRIGRADFTEKELSKVVDKQVEKQTGEWKGMIPETYFEYTNFSADYTGISNGVSPLKTGVVLLSILGGIYFAKKILESFDFAGDRPFVRKRMPYNNLYLERGGNPELMKDLPELPSEVYDPYPYYDKVYTPRPFK